MTTHAVPFPYAAARALRIERINRIHKYLLTWTATVDEVAAWLGLAKSTARIYLASMRKKGMAEVARESVSISNRGAEPATWTSVENYQPAVAFEIDDAPEIIAAPVADDEDDDDEPIQKTVTHWAHGMAKRYCMGRAI